MLGLLCFLWGCMRHSFSNSRHLDRCCKMLSCTHIVEAGDVLVLGKELSRTLLLQDVCLPCHVICLSEGANVHPAATRVLMEALTARLGHWSLWWQQPLPSWRAMQVQNHAMACLNTLEGIKRLRGMEKMISRQPAQPAMTSAHAAIVPSSNGLRQRCNRLAFHIGSGRCR